MGEHWVESLAGKLADRWEVPTAAYWAVLLVESMAVWMVGSLVVHWVEPRDAMMAEHSADNLAAC